MIPKIIHFCWFSNDPYPPKIKDCINSWEKYLKGYEIWLWNFNRFPRGKSKWVDQAFDSKKYAFAADYIRAYALYNYGGIYLDSDVELLANFDNFLHLPYFLGLENDTERIEAAVMGSEAGNEIFQKLLHYYDNRDFILPNGTFDNRPMPSIIVDIINKTGNKHIIDKITDFDYSLEIINIFTPDFFSPIHILSMEYEPSPNTISIHHFAGSWLPRTHRWKKRVQQLLGPKITKHIQKTKALLKDIF